MKIVYNEGSDNYKEIPFTYNFPIDVMMDSFRLSVPEAIKKAVAMGAKSLSICVAETCYLRIKTQERML